MQIRSLHLSMIALLLFSFQAHGKDKLKTLRVAIPYSLAPPLLMMAEKEKYGGIVKDYVDVIGKKIDRKFEYLVIPKFRIHELIDKGVADINCFTSPSWVPHPHKYNWSKVLFMKKEIIASRKKNVRSFSDIKGERVGAVLRYVYPHIDELFKSGRLLREDAPSEEQNLQKFVNGRLNNVIADEIHLNYYLKKHSSHEKPLYRITAQEYPIHCLFSTKDPALIASFNQAIESIKESGELQKIFSKYR